MAVYVSEQEIRDKLGNTIGGNYSTTLLANAAAYGCSMVDAITKTDWDSNKKYFGAAKGIALAFAAAFSHATQINVSIQQLREWNMANDDAKALYATLLSEGLIKQGKSMFLTDEYSTEFLNPVSGTRVSGLHGIVRRNRLLNYDDMFYTP